jgi:hypothetical protein
MAIPQVPKAAASPATTPAQQNQPVAAQSGKAGRQSNVAEGYSGADGVSKSAAALTPEAAAFAEKSPLEQESLYANQPRGYILEETSLELADMNRILGKAAMARIAKAVGEYPYGSIDDDGMSCSTIDVLKHNDVTVGYRMKFVGTGTSEHDSPVDLFCELGVDMRGKTAIELWEENG